MKGDVQICATVFSAALDYVIDSGLYLIFYFKKTIAVVLELVD